MSGKSQFQPQDMLGCTKHAVFFGWCCRRICLVFSFKFPPKRMCCSNPACTLCTQARLMSSSGAVRNARTGNQQSSVAYLHYINTVCSRQTLIIFVVELSQHIRHISVARVRWSLFIQTWQPAMRFYHNWTKWFVCFGFTLYCPWVPS